MRRDAWVISILLIVLFLQAGALLWHLGLVPGGMSGAENSSRQRAGRIVSIHNQLKQKPQGGLLWDQTEAGRDVYFYDSLLTLKESEAILELENSTRIQVGESTLITIEPPDQNSPRDIFIQFAKGNLRAKADRNKTKLNDGSIQLQLSPGADVEFIKDTENRGEVLVRSGQVEVSDGSGTKILNKDQLALLVNGEWQEQQISEELSWVKPPPKRLYSHQPEVPLNLSWQGPAEQLLLRDLKSGQQTSQNLTQSSVSINLKQGSYRLRLKKGKLLSPALDIQVWQAPLIHLLTPLPRNREVFGSIPFLWTPLEKSWTYQLKLRSLTSGEEVLTQDFASNEATLPLHKEADLLWEVWAKDADGFLSPPAYNYPLYLRENPLAPPKLKKPQRLKETHHQKAVKKSVSSLQNLLFHQAWGQTRKSKTPTKEWGALLSWEPMAGADLYQLEISEGKDFRTLILSIELTKPEFIFRSQKNPKELYWRVAAGTQSGRLGLFSEPEIMELVDARDLPQLEVQPSGTRPILKKVVTPPQTSKSQSVPQAKPVAQVQPSTPEQNQREIPPDSDKLTQPRAHQFKIWWGPGLQILEMDKAWPAKVYSQGFQELALGGNWQAPLSKTWDLHTLIHFQQSRHRPEPKDNYPFQEEISSYHLNVASMIKRPDQGWLWGAGVRAQPEVKRVSFEQIEFKDLWIPQAVVGWQTSGDKLEYQFRLHLGYHGQGPSVVHNHRLQHLHRWGLLLGIEYEGSWSQLSTGQLVEHHLRTQLGFFF